MQHNKGAKNQDMKIHCAKNHFTELKFLGPYNKPHGVCGLGKHYNMYFYAKLGHVIYEIHHIPCACTSCTSSLDQTWTPGFTEQKQSHYQPVKDCTHWPVVGSFNDCVILKLLHKATSSEEMDKIHQVVLYGISSNVAPLVQTDRSNDYWPSLDFPWFFLI